MDGLSILWWKGKKEQIKRNEDVGARLGGLEDQGCSIRNGLTLLDQKGLTLLAVAKDRKDPGQAEPTDLS